MSQADGVPRTRNADGTFKKPAEAAPAAPAAPQHPPYLTELGKSFGFDEDDFKVMTSEALGRAITKAQRRDAEWNQRVQAAQPQAIAAKPAPEPEPELAIDLDPAEYDEKLRGAFGKLRDESVKSQKELKALRDEIAQQRAREQERSNAQVTQLVDDAFEALGPEFEWYFGKGSASEIRAADPDAFERRKLVLQKTGLDASLASGKQVMSKIKQALTALKIEARPIVPPEADPEQTPTGRRRPTRKEWDDGATAVPTQRAGADEPKGYDRAVKNATARAKANGVPVGANHAKEDAELLATFKR